MPRYAVVSKPAHNRSAFFCALIPLSNLLQLDTDFLPHKLGQGTAISEIYPLAATFLFLDVVVALGSGDRGAEPDLAIRRLRVQNVCACGRKDEGEDSGLCASEQLEGATVVLPTEYSTSTSSLSS